MVSFVKGGRIGKILNLEASFTKIVTNTNLREYDPKQHGGSFAELGSYVLLPVVKFFGNSFKDITFYSHYADYNDGEIDIFTCGNIVYNNGVSSFKVGLGGKAEGDLVVSGTRGYIYVPAPWWKTEYFEIRHESANDVEKFFYKFEGDGLRYELHEMVSLINSKEIHSSKLTPGQSIAMSKIMEIFFSKKKTVSLI
jgi:predicted dehydrogenase